MLAVIENIKNINPIYIFLINFTCITFESLIPVLPLAAFITLNIIVFGNVTGYLISLVATILGCLISFIISQKAKIHIGRKLTFTNLVILLILPFTPSFIINIVAGLSKVGIKEYFLALLISKPFIVYFWGFIGTGILKNTKTLIESLTLLFLVYILSIILNKKIKTSR